MKLKIAGGASELQVSEATFGREFNEALVHQVITAYRNAGRAGTKAQLTKAEVSGGQMAQSKGSSDSVKQFGQRMATDHQKAYDQLSQIAGSKGVTVPTEPSKAHQRDAAKLEKLSGNDFDREYAKQMVSDHKKDVSEFRKQAKSAKDPDVRNFAATTLPTLEEHLKMAQDMESTVKKERTAKAGR